MEAEQPRPEVQGTPADEVLPDYEDMVEGAGSEGLAGSAIKIRQKVQDFISLHRMQDMIEGLCFF